MAKTAGATESIATMLTKGVVGIFKLSRNAAQPFLSSACWCQGLWKKKSLTKDSAQWTRTPSYLERHRLPPWKSRIVQRSSTFLEQGRHWHLEYRWPEGVHQNKAKPIPNEGVKKLWEKRMKVGPCHHAGELLLYYLFWIPQTLNCEAKPETLTLAPS